MKLQAFIQVYSDLLHTLYIPSPVSALDARIHFYLQPWSAPADTVLTMHGPYIYLRIAVRERCSTFKLIKLSSLSTLFASWRIIP
jgi:hypothetical protein